MSLRDLISKAISKSLGTSNNIFDLLMEEFSTYFESPSHTVSDLKRSMSKKKRGDLWEELCVLYLLKVKGYENAWRLKDVPKEILIQQRLGIKDIGIDLVASKRYGNTIYWYSIQCKYKANGGVGYNPNTKGYKSKGSVGWKELSTFYALCARTGPWQKHIVMCNCDYVSHMGTKSEKDLSICKKSFQAITKDQWREMIGDTGRSLTSSNDIPATSSIQSASQQDAPSQEQMREARLKFLERFQQKQ